MIPGSPEWKARVDRILAQELKTPERLFYLSFADENGWRGAIVTLAHGITDAMQKTHRLNINPGGEVACWPIPDGLWSRVNPKMLDLLLLDRAAIAMATGEPIGEIQTIEELEQGGAE